eukprot:CAMPEP_0194566670 /NCGR_PEP_ID=MMETSP0292-20121207/5459_1 /TAXON_ID=39354 /ORGANISM="Heterosigma akashiwo, Strain CCMP2393" /LENGTH=126 /DNA_ID=CAMNT_0039416299 /DNA_START=230 /DNA_END=607 /DNA_ORIENTATION=+
MPWDITPPTEVFLTGSSLMTAPILATTTLESSLTLGAFVTIVRGSSSPTSTTSFLACPFAWVPEKGPVQPLCFRIEDLLAQDEAPHKLYSSALLGHSPVHIPRISMRPVDPYPCVSDGLVLESDSS